MSCGSSANGPKSEVVVTEAQLAKAVSKYSTNTILLLASEATWGLYTLNHCTHAGKRVCSNNIDWVRA